MYLRLVVSARMSLVILVIVCFILIINNKLPAILVVEIKCRALNNDVLW